MPQKKGKEAKFERATWFVMIMVFALLRFDRGLTLPEYVVPIVIGLILILSGVYQITQKWPVSPFTWMIGIILLVSAFVTFYINLPVDLILLSFIGAVTHIIIGIISNES